MTSVPNQLRRNFVCRRVPTNDRKRFSTRLHSSGTCCSHSRLPASHLRTSQFTNPPSPSNISSGIMMRSPPVVDTLETGATAPTRVKPIASLSIFSTAQLPSFFTFSFPRYFFCGCSIGVDSFFRPMFRETCRVITHATIRHPFAAG